MKKRNLLIVIIAAILALAVMSGFGFFLLRKYLHQEKDVITVGFIYDNEQNTPYSYNFLLAQEAVQGTFQGQVKIMMYSDVMEDDIASPMEMLAANGCGIIFTNGYGNVRAVAQHHPQIQFCQVSSMAYPENEAQPNYHTFKGEIYQGRYVSGVVAGLKLKDLIETGQVKAEEAKVGFVAAYPVPEVISGFSAFILGVRSVVPEATMIVRYIDTWSSFTKEKQAANRLLDEGCVIISQHSDTEGPAVACEEYVGHPAFHVGYNVDMTDVAPHTSLISVRINWAPYIIGAVKAVLEGRPIEEVVDGDVHPHNDMSAGMERNWVSLTKLNADILPAGTDKIVADVIEGLGKGSIEVFKGDYIAYHPQDENDWIDLHNGFIENNDTSMPSFDYILQDVVTIDR